MQGQAISREYEAGPGSTCVLQEHEDVEAVDHKEAQEPAGELHQLSCWWPVLRVENGAHSQRTHDLHRLPSRMMIVQPCAYAALTWYAHACSRQWKSDHGRLKQSPAAGEDHSTLALL